MAKPFIKKPFIKIETPGSSETIEDIDAAVVIALRGDGDNFASKISTFSGEAIDARQSLIMALQPIAAKIRSYGRCSDPQCEGCATALKIADGVDALAEAEAYVVLH